MAQYILTRHITDLCLTVKRRPGPRVAVRWWEQESLDLEGMQTEAQEAERMDGGGETDGTENATGD